MKQKFRAAEILIALVVPTSTASAQRPAGPLMGTGIPARFLSLLKIPYNPPRNHAGKQIEDSISLPLCLSR